MLVDLVQVTTSDGLRLHGALELPPAPGPDETLVAPGPVDAWLCVHGTGSNFYAASTLGGLAPKLLAGGAAVLRANTRGHDLVSTGSSAGGLQGAAFERVDQAPADLAAWIDLLQERGFQRIGLLGHSLGAIKAIFTLAAEQPPPVSVLVAVSPPHLSHALFSASPRGDDFRAMYARADELVSKGQGNELLLVDFPLSYYVSAASYLDRYGPHERYNVVRLLPSVGCPTLVTFGSSELNNVAFRGLSEAAEKCATPKNSLQVAIIAGADHIYSGCHDALAGRIASWLGRQGRRQ